MEVNKTYEAITIGAVTFSMLAAPPSAEAQGNSADAAALRLIADFANRICQTVPLEIESNTVELSGKAKAELEGVVTQLTKLGIVGAGKYQSVSSRNVLQKDLAGAIKDSRDCRIQIWKDLKDRFDIGGANKQRSELPAIERLSKEGTIRNPRTDVSVTELQCVTAPSGYTIDPRSVEISPANPGGPRPWGYRQETLGRYEACFTIWLSRNPSDPQSVDWRIRATATRGSP